MASTSIFEEEKDKTKLNKKELQSDLLYGAAKGIGGAALKLINNLKVEGKEKIPLRGKAIITTISDNALRDMLVISQVSGRKIHFMVNHKLMKHQIAGPALKALGMFRSTKNKDDTEPIDKVFKFLNEKGDLVAMTPESKYDKEVQIKSLAGIIKFAVAGRAPIIPVAIYEEQDKLFNFIPIKSLKVKVGDPIEVERKLNRDKYRDQRYELAEDLLKIIDSLKSQAEKKEE